MGVYLRLKWKDKELDLNDKTSGRYYVDADFAPPTAGDLERGFAFNIIIQGSGAAEIERALSDLQRFLDLAQDPHAPLWLEYKADDTIPFAPKYGQFGRLKRYKIVPRVNAGENTITHQTTSYSSGGQVGNTSKLIANNVLLRIAADSTGQRQIVAQGKGGILGDYLGKDDGQTRGVIVSDAETNNFTNPVFDNVATWPDLWTIGSSLEVQQIFVDVHPEFVLYGLNSAKITHDGGGGSHAVDQCWDNQQSDYGLLRETP